MNNKYFFFALIQAVLFASCNNKDGQGFESIDLSIKHRHQINSFKIEKDGKVVFLEEKLEKDSELYIMNYNKTESDSIKNIVNKIALIKCDTLINPPLSRVGYLMIVNYKTDSVIYFNSNCKQQKLVDDLVLYIEQISSKKKKIAFYKSLLSPPQPPPLLDTIN